MKNKFKKIITTAFVSVAATSAIGCANTNTKIAKKINNGVEDFVSSINKLDYVETNNSSSNIGKIVSAVNEENLYSKMTTNTNIENTITRPSERSDNFKLYVLSTSPYITLTSDDNSLNLSMQVSTEKIEATSDDISNKINQLILKRAILMIYVNEINSGNVNLTEDNRKAINAYVNIIKENASFLNGNRGMVKNQLGMASNLINKQSEDNIVNYYIIKSGEALEIRSNKIESSISAIDSIISILEQNLTPNSCYYHNNLTTSYQNMITKFENQTPTSEDETLAKNIAESINMITPNNTTDSTITSRSTYPVKRNTINQNNQIQNNNSNDCIDCENNNKSNLTNNTRTIDSNNQKIQTLESHEEIKTQNEQNNSNNQINKAQNTSKNEENLSQNNIYNNNTSNTVRRRASMAKRNRTTNNNQVQQNNPTMNIDRLTPTNNDDNQNNSIQRQNSRTQTNTSRQISNNDLNRATRVPYRVSTNHTPD